ncbi:hypothetical protein FOL47_003237 [Perkinsus chesapeaki]|uniref:Uncharacterized protein n=1 Tax=Perkinsus chesapeaki TaxID=330153 RepID=A0A7J6N2U7_PERCH|nr:hypothetical protein FOL47_003237 [Perkinsus chesapeaki]
MNINDLEPPQQSVILECSEQSTDLDLVGYVKNRGQMKWPETAALQFCYGEFDGGCPAVPLANLAPGELAQVVIDLRELSGATDGVQHLVWCIVDSATGEVLDQNQLIEVFIKFTHPPANDEDGCNSARPMLFYGDYSRSLDAIQIPF